MRNLIIKSFFCVLFLSLAVTAKTVTGDTFEDYQNGVVLWFQQQGDAGIQTRIGYFKEVVQNIQKSDYKAQYKALPVGIKNNEIRDLSPNLTSAMADAEKVYPFKLKYVLFENSTVYAGVFGMTYLAVSDKTVQEMSAEELRLVIYHEYAHLLFLPEYIEATKNNNADKIKELEILCDLTALHLSGGDVKIYQSMLAKSGETDESSHPSMELRLKVLESAWTK